MSKFKVGDEVRALCDSLHKGIKKGEIGIVKELDYECEEGVRRIRVVPMDRLTDGLFLAEELELIEPKLTKNQRITTLENKVAELELIVEQLRKNNITIEDVEKHFGKPSTDDEGATITNLMRDGETVYSQLEFEGKQYRKVDREAREGDVVIIRKPSEASGVIRVNHPYLVDYTHDGEVAHRGNVTGSPCKFIVYQWGRTTENVDVYELIEHQPVEDKSKTPNQLRAEIIEKAKQFVIENIANQPGSMYEDLNLFAEDHWYETEFITKGNRVTALIYTLTGMNERSIRPERVGRADCIEGDVFNEHIGKAIALGRALGLDVSEFEQAVQPTFAVGQKMKVRKSKLGNATIYTIENLGEQRNDLSYEGKTGQKEIAHSGGLDDFYEIINDTNAIYEVNE